MKKYFSKHKISTYANQELKTLRIHHSGAISEPCAKGMPLRHGEIEPGMTFSVRFESLIRITCIFVAIILLTTNLQASVTGVESGIFRIILRSCDNSNKGFIQTGFRAKWNGKDGIITALHGVVGCTRITAAQGEDIYITDLIFVAADLDRDIAFLASRQLASIPGQPLPMANYNVLRDQLHVVGHPDGVLIQITNPLSYHNNPLVKLGVWHEKVRQMCEYRESPDCDINILLVREDPLIPGHSGAPVFNQNNQVIGIANGGIKGGYALLNWIIPYQNVRLQSVQSYIDQLQKLKILELTDLFAAPSSMSPDRFLGGEGTTISGQVMYGGYGPESTPIGVVSNYSKAYAIISLMEVETRKEVPIDYEYDPNTGKYSIFGVPSGKFTPFIRIESGYPFYKRSGGDFVSHLSSLNEDIVVAPHIKEIHRNLNVVHSVHLKRPVDNQVERTSTYDPPEILYRQNYRPSASTFEWDPVPGAVRYNVRILLMEDNGDPKTPDNQVERKNFNITETRIMPDLKVNRGNTYYMFLVTAYKGNNWNDLIGEFTHYYTNGYGGWFKFKVKEKPD